MNIGMVCAMKFNGSINRLFADLLRNYSPDIILYDTPRTFHLTVYLAHLSQRLIDELIIRIPMIRRPSSVIRRPSFTISNIFSKTAWPIKAKFYVEGGTKVCSRHQGHMTKMAATPIYGKNLSKILLQKRPADFHETWR